VFLGSHWLTAYIRLAFENMSFVFCGKVLVHEMANICPKHD